MLVTGSGSVNTGGSEPSLICASSTLVAYRAAAGGGSAIGVLPLGSAGRCDSVPLLHAGAAIGALDLARWRLQATAAVTAGDPGDPSSASVLVGAGCDDGVVKLWAVPESGAIAAAAQPLASLAADSRRVEAMLFHPIAQGILAVSAAASEMRIWDITASTHSLSLETPDYAQTIAWKDDGMLLAIIARNKLNIYDPRAGKKFVKSTDSHNGVKPSRLVWAGATDLLFSTGFNLRHDREYSIWDARNLAQPLVNRKIDSSPGILTPLYDADTNMLFLSGKGDTTIRWFEIKPDNLNAPIDANGTPLICPATLTGACLVPKLGLNVMECEVARILAVTSDGSTIIPISAVVPRKTHADFHADIFPDTQSDQPAVQASEWLAGSNKQPSLPTSTVSKAPIKLNLPKHSPYRFISGKVNSEYDDLKGLSVGLPNESDCFQVNTKLMAFPIAGPGGRLAHNGRVVIVRFHPTVSNVLLTYSPEQGTPLIKIWNILSKTEISSFTLPEQVLGVAFNHNGEQVAVVVRNKTLRIHDCRKGTLIQQGVAHDGVKAARVHWIGETGNLVSIGFGRGSQREFIIYNSNDLAGTASTTAIDTSPSLLVSHYDDDTGILMLAGRGESAVQFYDLLTDTKPTLLTRFTVPSGTQQVSILPVPKRFCDVRAIEVLKCHRLTNTSIETVSFTIPRQNRELFQDDIFVPTKDIERAALDVGEWLSGRAANLSRINLQPADMTPLSQAAPVERKVEQRVVERSREQTDAERKEATMKAMFELALEESKKGVLPQDAVEGVADDEWVWHIDRIVGGNKDDDTTN
eukprot:jgi/Hompol1/108/HPOL_002021-RA